MKLENQLSSLELSKKLKELGVKQESLFWWFKKELFRDCPDYKNPETFSAFTVAELGEMLPEEVGDKKLKCSKLSEKWIVGYWDYGDEDFHKIEYWRWSFGGTEADSRAKCLIFLIENKLITL